MLHSSSDAFQNSTAQPHHTQQRSSQMPRNQSYNAQATGAGYRGTHAPIAPYAFSSTPQLRQETKSTPAQQQQGHVVGLTRTGHPTHASSSSDSTVSTSGSSNHSLITPSFAAKEDGDFRKSVIDTLPGSMALSTPVPDLSLSMPEPSVKPSPGRYRRTASRTESSASVTGSSSTPTPTPQSPSSAAAVPAQIPRSNHGLQVNTTDLLPPTRPGHNRASSVDDMHMARGGNGEQAKRYRRRSLSGIEAMATTTAPLTAPSTAVTAGNVSQNHTQELRPNSSSSRHDRRPSSSQGHQRQGSSGSTASSHASNRPSVSHHFHT